MFVTITAPTYNRKYHTEYFLKTLREGTNRKHYELIVIDNHSTDGTVEFLKRCRNSGEVDKLILNPKNYHLGKAINQGWQKSSPKSKWLFWMNNDFFFMKGWLDNFQKVTTDLQLDYMGCLLYRNFRKKVKVGPIKTTKTGGKYSEALQYKRKGFSLNAALAIQRNLVLKHAIKIDERHFSKTFTGPGVSFFKKMAKLKLKGARLEKPCVLLQMPDIHDKYYDETYGKRGLQKSLKKLRNGHTSYIDIEKYYEGTNYLEEIGWQ